MQLPTSAASPASHPQSVHMTTPVKQLYSKSAATSFITTRPVLPCFSYLVIPSLLLHPVMEDSCVCFGIQSCFFFFFKRGSWLCTSASSASCAPSISALPSSCLFKAPPPLPSSPWLSSAQLGSAPLGDSSGEWTQKTALMGALRACERSEGQRGRAAPVNPAVAKTLGSERG